MSKTRMLGRLASAVLALFAIIAFSAPAAAAHDGGRGLVQGVVGEPCLRLVAATGALMTAACGDDASGFGWDFWTDGSIDSNRWMIRNTLGETCLDSTGNGTLFLSPCDGRATEIWAFGSDVGIYTRLLLNFQSGQCLDSDRSTHQAFTAPCARQGWWVTSPHAGG